uniref:protein NRT1/ PTR FAMILY 4.5-like n=1 Tax=Erigeron canadensis TaxID=72917 RepID=UPI001CB99414|nr:protein NRT1/ PTR FAMILY 4.5-like [Erigeron canadensis]
MLTHCSGKYQGIAGDVAMRPQHQKRLGGTRAALFVYATTGLENMAFISTAVSLVTYFYGYMNFSLTKSATTLTNYLGTAFLLSLFGGFISDTYLSRFKAGILFASFEVVGYALLAVQAHFEQLRPTPCNPTQVNQCQQATSNQEAILFTGLYLVAFGTGGVKAALPSLGADQFDERNPKEAESLASFFNWLLFSITTGAIFGVTFVVWICSNPGWDWGLGVCSIAVLVAALFLLMGRSMFRDYVPKESPILRILQVFMVAIKNRNIPLPENAEELHEIHDREAGVTTDILQRTDQFRFLDKAAIITSSLDASELRSSGSWKLCTVTQVEELKIIIRMLPIILSTIFMNTCLAQLQTFTIQQSTTMDRNLLGFQVPGSSIPVIPLVFMSLLIPVYDRFFVPFVRKFTGIHSGIRHLQRIGVGLVLSAISMAVAGIVETRRKSVAIDNNLVDSPGPLPISVFWLGYQYAIFGLADMFTLVGLLEFFYEESSPGMKSLGTSISWCSLAFGYYSSSIVVEVVNKVSNGWLASNNLNRDKLNNFYWLLAGLSIVNLGIYLMCASWYKYKEVNMKQIDTGSNAAKANEVNIQVPNA